MDMKRRNVDMLEGDLWLNVLLFAIPVMLSGILQLLFNAIDMIVVESFPVRLRWLRSLRPVL